MAGKKMDSIMGEFAKTLNLGVSDSDTGREQIEYIDIDLLDDDPRNFYALDGLDELASNIQVCGLQQPIRVRVGEDGRYTIVSGHRRRAALRKLVEDGVERFRQVPCILERDSASPAMQELRLIYANSDTRKMSNYDIARQAERVTELLYQLQEEGVEFPGRMRDHVAEACKVSKSKIARLSVIRTRLGPEFLPLFEKDKLPEQSAYTLAKFPRVFQTRLRGAFSEIPTGSTLERLLGLYKDKGYRWEPAMSCPDGKPCKRGDAFLRHDADCLCYEDCGGKTCCLECKRAFEEYYACDKACSKAKAKRKDARDEAKAKEMEREAAKKVALQKEIRASAQRILKAIDSADLRGNVNVVWTRYGRCITAKDIRNFANGDFSSHNFYANELSAQNLLDVGKTARLLHCTTDFILGLTDDPKPPAAQPEGQLAICGWMPGGTNPGNESGWCVCMMALDPVKPLPKALWWDGAAWKFRPGGADAAGLEPLAWMRLPEYEGGNRND